MKQLIQHNIGAHFKEDGEGRTVYFPFGIGRGYTVPSERKLKRLRGRITIFYSTTYFLMFGMITANIQNWLSFWHGLVIIVGYSLFGCLLGWLECQDLERSNEKPNWGGSINRAAESFSFGQLWTGFWACLIMAVAGMFWTINDGRIVWEGLAWTAGFGVGTLAYLKAINIKEK